MKEKKIIEWLLRAKPVAARIFWSLATDPQIVQLVVNKSKAALTSNEDDEEASPETVEGCPQENACPLCGGSGRLAQQQMLLETPGEPEEIN